MVPIELARFGNHSRHPNDAAALLLERAPGRDVRMMVQLRDHDFVARSVAAAERAREVEGERGHVRAEGDLVRRGIQKIRQRRASRIDDGVRFLARRISPMGIRIVMQQIIAHRCDHDPRHLRAAGAIEVGHRMTVVNARESGEMLSDFRIGNGRGGGLLRSLDH